MAKRMASNLRPPALDDLGLVDAIEWQAEQIASRAGLSHRLVVEPEALHVSPAVATTAYRIIQEALTNVVRHAKAANVEIFLTLEGQALTICVEDDGIGWPEGAQPPAGIGIRGMRERAELIGGTLELKSAPGQGTTIRLSWVAPAASVGGREQRKNVYQT